MNVIQSPAIMWQMVNMPTTTVVAKKFTLDTEITPIRKKYVAKMNQQNNTAYRKEWDMALRSLLFHASIYAGVGEKHSIIEVMDPHVVIKPNRSIFITVLITCYRPRVIFS